MRCRPVASWSWSRFQGSGCSPVKAVRELGLERRETVDCAVYKFGQLLERPGIPALLALSDPTVRVLTCAVTMRWVMRSISSKDWMPT